MSKYSHVAILFDFVGKKGDGTQIYWQDKLDGRERIPYQRFKVDSQQTSTSKYHNLQADP